MTSVDVLARAPAEPSAPALVTPTRIYSYEALSAAVDERVAMLTVAGHDRVGSREAAGVARGVLYPLVVESDGAGVIDLLALWRIGAVPAPINPRLTDAERARAVHSLPAAPSGAHVVVWTSGTAGRPRGVAISFASFEASSRAAADRLGLGPHDVWLASLSVAHVGGLALLIRSLLLGGCVVARGAFTPGGVSDALDAKGLPDGAAPVSHMSLVPTQLLRLLEQRRGEPPPDTLRCVLMGGAHTPAALVARAHRAAWPLALTYGATEMCSQIATAPPELTLSKPGTAGPPLSGVEVEVAPDGEILARGPTQALGVGDADGWYHTGDLGRLDDDGHLWITGRRADRIVSGGVTIDAVEVEEALREHPAVIDTCVVGVPDDEWGERVAAWVEPVEGEFDETEVAQQLGEILSAPKIPRLWHSGGTLPRNANGKVDRAAVRDALRGL